MGVGWGVSDLPIGMTQLPRQKKSSPRLSGEDDQINRVSVLRLGADRHYQFYSLH